MRELLLLLLFLLLAACEAADPGGAGLSIVDSAAEGGEKPSGCPVSCFRPDPVCGVNGVTYWCGHRDAECDRVQISHAGYCSPENGGAGKGVMAGQALLVVHLLWLLLAGIMVLLGLP